MKITVTIKMILLMNFMLVFNSCAKDNYDPPSSEFKGRLIYEGEPIGVENGQVQFELWQPGFGKNGAINVNVLQDGNFSSVLFNGTYKLVFTPNQGPFYWPRNSAGAVDTIEVSISGNKSMDIDVTPYWIFKNTQFTISGKTVITTFGLEKIITDENARDLENISLYINKTQFVSANNTQNIAKIDLNPTAITNLNNISLSIDIPDISPIQNYIFARVGVKIQGVEDMLYSIVTKINF